MKITVGAISFEAVRHTDDQTLADFVISDSVATATMHNMALIVPGPDDSKLELFRLDDQHLTIALIGFCHDMLHRYGNGEPSLFSHIEEPDVRGALALFIRNDIAGLCDFMSEWNDQLIDAVRSTHVPA